MTLPSNDRVGLLDPLFSRLHAATERHVWDPPQLTTREKVFVCVVADVCNQTLGLPFELHVTTGLRNGMTTGDIRDLLSCVAFETGYPAALAAFERLALLEQSADLPPGATAEPTGAGADPPVQPPAAVRAIWREVDEGLGEFLELQSRMVGRLDRLSVRERSFAAMTCDVLYQTLTETFRVHIGRALGAGARPDDIRALVRFATQFGVAKAWNAFRALDRHLADPAPQGRDTSVTGA
jgi:alkylhydroperoxidase/carboxymuconolactone decarboxylase family protein YurZ